ncbi:TonB-dependent receptor [Variovorax guangxiensis]|uniref:TonB-dependent siderophore receptor n=1 Tax=Variovorax guangxiensis TaxID=1775474 RepID=A0A502DXY7_9BURK|nr:MAG: TonB-dependent siderophore receptor [Variovorax sp.]TPG26703.1 TonB-dependent siderophore receptor [Variovorax ginsengisoli]TPG30428.1 TonB-dependent siderophore receptor [Variovorax guangxiensis]
MPLSTVPSSSAEFRFAPNPLAHLIRQCLGAGLVLAAAGVAAQTTSNTTLQEVVVSDQAEAIGNLQKTYSGGQLARGGNLGILGITDLMNVPFSTTNYTSELIDNQQALTIADVVMNDASVRPLTSRGGFGDDFQIRGFTVPNGDSGFNGLFGLLPTTRVPLQMVERVEVLKGPGSFVNGMSPNASIGGSINVVTKRANDVPLTRLTGTYMGESQFGTHLDVGRRFGEDNQWGVRVNGVWRNGEGNVDGGRERLGLGSIGLDYAGTRLRWSLDALSSRGKTVEFRPQISFAANVTRPLTPPSPRGNFYPGTDLKDNVDLVSTRLEYDIDDRTTIYGSLGYSEVDYQQIFPRAVGGLRQDGSFNVTNNWYDFYGKTTAAEAGVRTRFNTGAVKHTLALGVNKLDQETGNLFVTGATRLSNIYNPTPLVPLTGARGEPPKANELEQHSIGLVDTMSFANDRVLLTLGLRDQTIEQKNALGVTTYKKSAISPMAGLVFKPIDNVSVYTNYTDGLVRGGVAPLTAANRDEVFAPQKSKQYEVGVKADWGRLMTQVAVYEIKRPSAYTDPATNLYSFGGEQRNRGLELTAYGEVTRGLRAMASAAFIDAKLTRTAGGTNQGNSAPGVPDRTFNLGLDWDTPWVPGLSLNGRVIHTAEVYTSAANNLLMPSWTRLDIGARYATQVAGKPVVLRANLENVADKAYWITSTYVTVGAPRTLMLSAQIDF